MITKTIQKLMKMIFGWKNDAVTPYGLKILIVLLIFIPSRGNTQNTDTILQIIDLDSISIQANMDDSLDVNEFIHWMIQDESFYRAFKNLRAASYSFTNQISILDKDLKTQASYSSNAVQSYIPNCRTMTEKNKKVNGDYYSNGVEYKWYTAKLYDRLFFTHGMVCSDSAGTSSTDPGRMEKYIQELKKLMFAPGTRSHVPLLGDRTAIFDEEMQPYYNYRFGIDTLHTIPYYLFTVEVKPEFQNKNESKTVVKKLETWFDISTRQIFRRDYHLVGHTIAYSFDVSMHVDVTHVGEKYFPCKIDYDGTWKIFSKKRENAKFTIEFSDFKF